MLLQYVLDVTLGVYTTYVGRRCALLLLPVMSVRP